MMKVWVGEWGKFGVGSENLFLGIEFGEGMDWGILTAFASQFVTLGSA